MTRTRFYIGLDDKNGNPMNLTDEAIVGRFIDKQTESLWRSFSIQRQMGVWEGKLEPSFVIEVIHEQNKPSPLELVKIAKHIAFCFDQQAVLFTTENVFAKLVYASND